MKTEQNRKTARSVNVAEKAKPQNRTHLYSKEYKYKCGCGEDGGLSAAPAYPKQQDAFDKGRGLHAAIAFFHECEPPTATAQQRRHNRSGANYLKPAAKKAKAIFKALCEKHAPPEPLKGAIRFTLIFTFSGTDDFILKTTPPDLDNLEKLFLDAATKSGWWKDDAQVAFKTTAKFTGPIPGISAEAASWQPY